MGKTGKGDCYYVSGNAVINHYIDKRDYIGEPHLVHAEVQGQGDISHIRFGHAWIEDDVNVYDFSNNRELIIPKVVYYHLGDVKTDNPLKYQRYTFNEARHKMVESGHYGCWDLDVEYAKGGTIESYARGGRTKPNKIVKNLQEEVDRVKNEIIDNADISDENKEKLKKIPAYVVNQHRGVASYSRGFFSIPLWAYDRQHLDFKDFKIKYSTWRKDWFEKNKVHEGYFIYYVAHELAHWLCYFNNNGVGVEFESYHREAMSKCIGHNDKFYKAFKELCPYQYQHFERVYIKGSARQGIPTYEQCKLTPAEEQTPQTEHCGTEEVSKKQKDMNEFKTIELQKRSFDEIPKVRSEMSLHDIIDGLKSVAYLYQSDKKPPVRDLLSDYVAKGFHYIDDSKAFTDALDNSKTTKRIKEELFPLVITANSQLPTTKKFPIGDIDFGGTRFLRFLPKSYVEYLEPNDLKGIRVNQILKEPYPINPTNEDLQRVFQSWLGDDDLRPVMSGINFDEFGATGTDAHRLLHLVGKKEGTWNEGVYKTDKALTKWYKDLEKQVGDIGSFDSFAHKNRKIDGTYQGAETSMVLKYPNYSAVVNFSQYEKYATLNTQLMADCLNIVTKNRLSNLTTHQIIMKFGDREIGANAMFLLQNFKTWLELGVDYVDMYLYGDDSAYVGKAIIFLPKGTKVGWADLQNHSYSLIMPVHINRAYAQNTFIEYVDENEIKLIVDNSPPFVMLTNYTSDKTQKWLDMKSLINDLNTTIPFLDEQNATEMQNIISGLETTLPYL